jgi:hypothetical protein
MTKWQEQFDSEFWLHRIPRNTKQSKDIKDFIQSLLSQQREELLGKKGECPHMICLICQGESTDSAQPSHLTER